MTRFRGSARSTGPEGAARRLPDAGTAATRTLTGACRGTATLLGRRHRMPLPLSRRALRRYLLAALLAATSPVAGCGGSSTAPTPPPPPQPGITFTPSIRPAPSGSIGLQARASTPQEVTLSLDVTSVPLLYGYAVDVVYDTALLTFDGFEEQAHLGSDGSATTVQVVENPAGRLVIGHSRLGPVGPVGGSGELLRLTFTAVTAGSGPIALDSGVVLNAVGDEQSVEFVGGTIRVVQ